jgi:hypothetical protein
VEEQQEAPIRCHQRASLVDVFANVNGPPCWKQRNDKLSTYRHCSFCDSLHPDDVRQILEDGGRLGGADWKYGNPHKFYVYPRGSSGMYRWYNVHLHDLDDEAFEAFAALLAKCAGIEFFRDAEGQVMYRAPYHGYQKD